MSADRMTPATIDEYISAFPPEVRVLLQNIRATIRQAAPDAVEKISYRMPAFSLERGMVYFGAFKDHIGFYPPIRDEGLKSKAAAWAGEKGNLKFPLDKSIPYALIGEIVKARARIRVVAK